MYNGKFKVDRIFFSFFIDIHLRYGQGDIKIIFGEVDWRNGAKAIWQTTISGAMNAVITSMQGAWHWATGRRKRASLENIQERRYFNVYIYSFIQYLIMYYQVF